MTTVNKRKPITTGWKFAAREVGISVAAASAIFFTVSPLAHWWSDQPRHGGQIRMTEQHHLELVATPEKLTVYMTDHEGLAKSLDGVKMYAGLNGKTAELMMPSGKNSMEVKGKFDMDEKTMVIVKVDFECADSETAIFVPLDKEPPLPLGIICSPPKPKPSKCTAPKSWLDKLVF